ncbi:hypothetical protein Q9R08_05075 [Microbacterium sp. QXD-8]|uniref:ASCH domain-containing protein n=1 Tax=Microbacterium psychrotolerans TaxID=3068321 RepID=A0ABU0YYD8_9MICO|nr:hypothetical protein [Microbacterium sp. QXD-8]MDQ7877345.1 hypothetical protein [Microbacterium sp. QXD-8]
MTVRQPWAWAIIHAGKNVENRVRNIAGDYRGPVLIHAGIAYDTAWSSPALYDAMHATGVHRRRGEYPWHLNHGAIIGVVDLVDSHPVESCIEQQQDGDWLVCSAWAERAGHHLVLTNPRALDELIPYTGALGLRKAPFEVVGDWLAEYYPDRCTCGQSGIAGPHEPGCGLEPVAQLLNPGVTL